MAIMSRDDNKNNIEFELIDDELSGIESAKVDGWKVLVVDDEEGMHHSTRFALKDVEILGKPIILMSAYSALEARDIIFKQSDIAVLLLDVVMEGVDAGLKLVEEIRRKGIHDARIILITGQPGYAPMYEVIRDYDINDYQTKTEMTRNRLVCSLMTALRSWQQIRVINESRKGLEMVVESSRDLFKRKNMELFSHGVLKQLIAIQGVSADGIVCVYYEDHAGDGSAKLRVVTASGKYRDLINEYLTNDNAPGVLDVFERALESTDNITLNGHLGVCIESEVEKNLFFYIDHCSILHKQQLTLLKLFAANVAVGFENLTLIEKLDHLAYMDSSLEVPNVNSLSQALTEIRKTLSTDLYLVTVHIKSAAQCIGAFGIDTFNKIIKTLFLRLEEVVEPTPFIIASNGKYDLLLLSDFPDECLVGVRKAFDNPVSIDDIEISVSAFTTIVEIKKDMDALSAIKNSVSTVLSLPKKHHNEVHRYEDRMTSELEYRVHLQSQLNKAIKNHADISAWLQPKVSMNDRCVVGAEALCRWKLNGEYIPPHTFIPITEATGMADKLTLLMLESVSQLRCGPSDHRPSRIAINLSVQEIQHKYFASRIDAYARSLGLTPDKIEFEITESVLMHDMDTAIQELTSLKQLGYSISLDDFGTGYSSLSYLDQLPIDHLKIDKSFVSQLLTSSSHHNLINSTIALAKGLNISVIAEGIESVDQHKKLMDMGCDFGQGYFYGRPVPVQEFVQRYAEGPLPTKEACI